MVSFLVVCVIKAVAVATIVSVPHYRNIVPSFHVSTRRLQLVFLSNTECDHFSTSNTTTMSAAGTMATMTTILYSFVDRAEACDLNVAINV